MYKSHITGKIGEKIAQEYLIKNDYEILVKNFRCKQGEIDIIANDKNELVFIEVKTRTNKKYGNPIDAVTYTKRKHIINTIKFYLYITKLENVFIRIDIIELLKKEDKIYIRHTKNAISL